MGYYKNSASETPSYLPTLMPTTLRDTDVPLKAAVSPSVYFSDVVARMSASEGFGAAPCQCVQNPNVLCPHESVEQPSGTAPVATGMPSRDNIEQAQQLVASIL